MIPFTPLISSDPPVQFIISFTNNKAGNYIAVGTNGKIIHNLPEEELPDGELSILENWKDLVFAHVSYNNPGDSRKYHIYGVKKDGSIKNIKIGKVYRHFKGNYYFVENVALDSETKEEMVLYTP